MYCIECLNEGGDGKRCYLCGKKKRITQSDKNREEIIRARDKERHEFLTKMHKRLTDLNVKTTGDPVVDETIRREIGDF